MATPMPSMVKTIAAIVQCSSREKAVNWQRWVTVQVVKTGLTPQIAPSDHLREAEKEQLHPAEQLHTLR